MQVALAPEFIPALRKYLMEEAMNGLPDDDTEAANHMRKVRAVDSFLSRLNLEIDAEFRSTEEPG